MGELVLVLLSCAIEVAKIVARNEKTETKDDEF